LLNTGLFYRIKNLGRLTREVKKEVVMKIIKVDRRDGFRVEYVNHNGKLEIYVIFDGKTKEEVE